MSDRVVLELPPSRRNSRNSEGAFVTLSSGRVLFIYTRFGGHSGDEGAAVLAARHSDDGGRTWSTRDRVVVENEGRQNVMSVSLLRLRDGRIMLLYLRKDGDTRCMPLVRFSEDEGKTFTKPASVIGPEGYHVVNNDRVVQLRDGRLVVPVGLHRRRGPSDPTAKVKPGDGVWDAAALIFYYLSDDGGRNWFESRNAIYRSFPANGGGMQEPGVVELRDGRLWSWARCYPQNADGYGSQQWQTYSLDRGTTWCEPEASPHFYSAVSPMSVKRLPGATESGAGGEGAPSGDLLAVWSDRSRRFKLPDPKPISWGRTPLVSAISKDEGLTWGHHRLVERSPEHGFCYTAIHFVDGAALLAYCSGGASTKMVLDRLRVRRIAIEDLDA